MDTDYILLIALRVVNLEPKVEAIDGNEMPLILVILGLYPNLPVTSEIGNQGY